MINHFLKPLLASLAVLATTTTHATCVEPIAPIMQVTSAFGWRAIPEYQNQWRFHYGVDLHQQDAVKAGVTGKFALFQSTPGCGNMVVITPGDQTDFKALKLCHLRNINSMLANGSAVSPATTLGDASNVGLAKAAPHIHIELISSGDATSSANSKRIPLTQSILCGGTLTGKEPVGDLVGDGGAALFDKDYYATHYGAGQQVTKSAEAAGTDALSAVETSGKMQTTGSGTIAPGVPLDTSEGTFMSVMNGLVMSRFGSPDWTDRLVGMMQKPLLFELLQSFVADAYLELKYMELIEETSSLLAERHLLWTEINQKLSARDAAQAKNIATRSTN